MPYIVRLKFYYSNCCFFLHFKDLTENRDQDIVKLIQASEAYDQGLD